MRVREIITLTALNSLMFDEPEGIGWQVVTMPANQWKEINA